MGQPDDTQRSEGVRRRKLNTACGVKFSARVGGKCSAVTATATEVKRNPMTRGAVIGFLFSVGPYSVSADPPINSKF